jgi:hypothetical protein
LELSVKSCRKKVPPHDNHDHGSEAACSFIQLDAAAKEWIGLIAYRLMGWTDALFSGRS